EQVNILDITDPFDNTPCHPRCLSMDILGDSGGPATFLRVSGDLGLGQRSPDVVARVAKEGVYWRQGHRGPACVGGLSTCRSWRRFWRPAVRNNRAAPAAS